jgi:heptosyltransferase-2
MKIAVFLPNWIGDAVMATPALRAIRERYREAEILGVVRPYVADVLAGLDLLDRTLLHDPRRGSSAGRGWKFVRSLRREQIDWAVLFPNSLRSAWMARLSGARRRVGMSRDGRGWLLTDRIAPKSRRVPNPVIDEYLRIAAHLDCTHLSRRMELAVTAEDEARWRDFAGRAGIEARGRGMICLNPGGAFGAAKHWPPESFARLAQRVAGELGKTVLVLCGPSERDAAREIVTLAGDPHVLSLADETLSLGLTKAAIHSADLLVTTDSGPRHFAPPLGVPVITLFGPTHIAWSETFVPDAVHLQLDVECGPCQKRVCPLGHHRCMRDLTSDSVFQAVVNLLHRTQPSDAAA